MNKKIRHIIVGLIVILTAVSCDNWLDVTASSEIKAEDQFKSEAGFKDALMGVYIGMTKPELYSRNMTWNVVDLLSQQYSVLPSLSQYDEIQNFKYETPQSVTVIDAFWNKQYNVIANLNSALKFIDKNRDVLNDINYSIIKGEFLGLRALLHFDLMRLYGYGNISGRSDIVGKYAIPYVSEYSKNVTPQLSYEKTFELLLNDVNDAIELLKEDPVYTEIDRPDGYYMTVNNDGYYDNRENRMNYYAVKALKARILMWIGGEENMKIAAAEAEEIILKSYARLIDSETYNIDKDPTFYPEHIFNLNIEGFESIVNVFLNAEESTNYNALFLTSGVADEVFETSNSNIGIADVRYNKLLDAQTSGKVCIKLYQENNRSHNNIMPLMKISEMYYIVAEYNANKTAPELSKAISYLNTVRSSRGILEVIPDDADQARVNDELLKEYRKEFISEGQLFFYYKRLGKTNIPGLSEDIIVGDDIYLLPYPADEIEFGNRVQ